MNSRPLVVLINPNTDPRITRRMADALRREALDIGILGLTAPYGPALIVDEVQLAQAADVVVSMADAVPDTAAGVIVGAFGDPGADALAASLRVPVVGLAEASFAAASRIGRFAIVTTTPGLRNPIEDRVRATDHTADYVGLFFTEDDDAERLMAQPSALHDQLREATVRASAAGADCICIGGGPLSGLADRLRPSVSIPLLDPVKAALWMMRARITAPPTA